MSERVTIDRLTVTLVGWPADAADGLGGALEQALRERLATAAIGPGEAAAASVSLGVSLGATPASAGQDAALADRVADRLVSWLSRGAATEDGHG